MENTYLLFQDNSEIPQHVSKEILAMKRCNSRWKGLGRVRQMSNYSRFFCPRFFTAAINLPGGGFGFSGVRSCN